MSRPLTHCELRRALDTNNWNEVNEIMEYNKNFFAFSIIPCRGHWFKKRCSFSKKELKIIIKKTGLILGNNFPTILLK